MFTPLSLALPSTPYYTLGVRHFMIIIIIIITCLTPYVARLWDGRLMKLGSPTRDLGISLLTLRSYPFQVVYSSATVAGIHAFFVTEFENLTVNQTTPHPPLLFS